MKIENIKIKDLKPYDKNARTHPAHQITTLVENIERYGFTVPMLVDENNTIIAGHGRLQAVTKMGWKEVPCVRMEGLTPEEVKALRISDNRLAELAEWDNTLLLGELSELAPELFDLTGFDPALLQKDEPDDDQVPWIPKKPKTKTGDLYELGDHRILCGDASNPDDINKLLNGEKAHMTFTDPPYNVEYEGKTKDALKIKNDKMTREAFYEFLKQPVEQIIKNTIGGIYICMSSKELGTLHRTFQEAGGHLQTYIVWVKNTFTLSRTDYQNKYEQILYGWPAETKNHYFINRRDLENVWEDLSKLKTEYDGTHTTISFHGFKVEIPGEIKEGRIIKKKQKIDIWRHNKPSASKEHPTMKPVSLIVEAIHNSTRPGQIVLDPFLGSGSTIIAADKLNRKGYGLELDPKYVDVAVQRYVEYTGKTKIKVNGKIKTWTT